MIELAFVACLGAEPTRCENRALQFVDMPLTACVAAAQPQLASWQEAHPNWVIRRWVCRPAGSGGSA